MSTLDLRAHARRARVPRIDVSAIDPTELDAARTNWRERMASEHASARVFGALVGQMMQAGLPEAEIRRVGAMVEQELDHARLCAGILLALDGDPEAPYPRLDALPAHEDATPLEAVLRNVISIGCCSETVAVALVATEQAMAGPPPVQRVLRQILADEIKHARFGWRIVAKVAPELGGDERERLDEYLVDVFDHQLRFHAPFLSMPRAGRAGVAIGAPNGASNWACFLETTENVIVPGLERHGFAAARAWATARTCA